MFYNIYITLKITFSFMNDHFMSKLGENSPTFIPKPGLIQIQYPNKCAVITVRLLYLHCVLFMVLEFNAIRERDCETPLFFFTLLFANFASCLLNVL